VTKGVVALAAHLLVERCLLDLEQPVARYWPEFAQNGKTQITVRQAMSHQASLAIIDEAGPGDMLDWSLFTTMIAEQSPNWPPATNECYHAATFGFIVGEIVRRVDGRPIDRFIAEELAMPLGADYILGCTDADIQRVAPQIFNPENQLMGGGLLNEKTVRVFNGAPAAPEFFGSPAFFKWIFPSGSGVSNALGLARLFAPLANGGRTRGQTLFSPATLAAAGAEQWHHDDSLAGIEYRVAVGLNLNCEASYYGRHGNVGSFGGGGYTVFADPKNKITFAYTPNRFTSGTGLGREPRRLVDALYASL
jgi:CubicO group peptidase (beta-lactamase class C family)